MTDNDTNGLNPTDNEYTETVAGLKDAFEVALRFSAELQECAERLGERVRELEEKLEQQEKIPVLDEPIAMTDEIDLTDVALGGSGWESRDGDALPTLESLMKKLALDSTHKSDADVEIATIAADECANEKDDASEASDLVAPAVFFEEGSDADRRDDTSHRDVECLLVMRKGGKELRFPIYKSEMTIGRSKRAEIQVDGECVSRIHARIVRAAGVAMIEDAGSKNGLQVNSKRVVKQVLSHGDTVSVGAHTFEYVDLAVAS